MRTMLLFAMGLMFVPSLVGNVGANPSGPCLATTFLAITLPFEVTIDGLYGDVTTDTFYFDERGGPARLIDPEVPISIPLVGLSVDGYVAPLHTPGLAPGGYGTWLYAESNGVPGLQRGGSSIFDPNDQEYPQCSQPNPDTLIY